MTASLIHAAVAAQAARDPEATALVWCDREISYGVLETAATDYAAELADRGVGPGQIVPLLMDRSPEMVALQLAVLKTGAAYANLDPNWPAERKRLILDLVAPVLAVTHENWRTGRIPSYRPADDGIWGATRRARAFDPVPVSPETPATVFFTSGTTGVPKGVVSPHRAVTRLFGLQGLAGFGPGHVTPQVAALPWDMYAFELWGQLTTGGTVVLVPESYLLPNTLRDLVSTQRVDTLWLTAAVLNLFVDEDPDCFRGLRQVITGGETASPEHHRGFLLRHPDIALWNAYGPAEGCMITTMGRVTLADCDRPDGIPIGTAVRGTTVLLLDEAERSCGPGQEGEICLTGLGLADGYLGQPDLTRDRFPEIVCDGRPVRVYRTGDMAVFDDEGILQYHGRRDRQIKVNGFRIELAEIESAATSLPAVRNCLAFPLNDPAGRPERLALVYLLPRSGRAFGSDEIDPLGVHAELRRLLPGYLVPSIVCGLPEYPMTANGKVDRKALRQLVQYRRSGSGARTMRAPGPAAAGSRLRRYPMSREQEALWVDDQVAGGPSRYLEHWACTLSGPLDVDALEWALGQIVERHEVLRTRLTEDAGEPVQIVTDPAPVRLVRRARARPELPAELDRVVAEPLDLDEAPLRPWLIDVHAEQYVLVVQFHHAVIDDWALNVFQRELRQFYEFRTGDRALTQTPLPMQAGDHALAQRAAGLPPADLAYWTDLVRDAPRSCTIPPDRPGPVDQLHRNRRHTFRIDPEVIRSVRAVGRDLHATPFTVFAGAMAMLLWQYGWPDEVIFGAPVSLRGTADVDGMIGYLSNPLPIRLAVAPDTTVRSLIGATKSAVLGALAHRSVPYSQLVRMARVGSDVEAPPLCDVGLVVDDMHWEPFALGTVVARRIYIPPTTAKFSVNFSLMADDDGGYTGFCDYDADVFLATTMVRATERFGELLAHCAAGVDEPLAALSAPAVGAVPATGGGNPPTEGTAS